ncbi:ABC transporter ATP-binding protein [Patulibacter sp. S7RM1-6]
MLEIRDLHMAYGDSVAVENVTMTVDDGELVCVVGPSGAGKTTLLRCIAGLQQPTSGEVVLGGSRVTAPPPELAVVFQEYGRSLMPWMTVRDNVALPLLRSVPKSERAARVDRALDAVGLSAAVDRHPWQLSGGMQQRVAIARALAYQPQLLLMDEPFASVDAQTRADLEDLVLRLRAEYGMTVLFVTHDIDEAVYVGDRVVILEPSPTAVRESLPIDLPAPRDQITTKELPAFATLRAHVYRQIKREKEAAA